MLSAIRLLGRGWSDSPGHRNSVRASKERLKKHRQSDFFRKKSDLVRERRIALGAVPFGYWDTLIHFVSFG